METIIQHKRKHVPEKKAPVDKDNQVTNLINSVKAKTKRFQENKRKKL